jgi:CubicO group peptidase (beta-lactamase class C family)
VLGRIIEVVAGQPYERFIDERILKPLGTLELRSIGAFGTEGWVDPKQDLIQVLLMGRKHTRRTKLVLHAAGFGGGGVG